MLIRLLSGGIFLFLCCFQLTVLAQKTANKPFVLVIDPGHGGKDPGKPRGSTNHLHEKDVNLSIALKLGEKVRANMPDAKVIFTRKTDVYIPLEERVNIANNANADLFISIHCNSNPNKWIAGTKTHIHSHDHKSSQMLAYTIEEALSSKGGRKSRGVMSAYDRGYNLYVLQNTMMPSVLVECGFLTNPYEQTFLNDRIGQVKIANALSQGIQKFRENKHPYQSSPFIYKVQVLASDKKVPLDSAVFSKLNMPVEEHKMPGNGSEKYYYKYMVGEEKNSDQATKLKHKVRDLGYKDAFVVKFR
ncbi:N-acetylmuramoyl-L-alanine amidase [Limibacter armeniacum]|uniref:N-acetylmuramoyl-L-alanine amidase n=1 Tax=Limibacter armeniacum TaxID=466084 RepID=UPI002FE69FC8